MMPRGTSCAPLMCPASTSPCSRTSSSSRSSPALSLSSSICGVISLTQDLAARTKSIRLMGCAGLKVLYIVGIQDRVGEKPKNIRLRRRAHSCPVLRLVRQHPAHAAARIFLVAAVARDEMDVQVRNGLTAGRTVVDADVVAVGLVVLVEDVLRLRQHPEQRSLLGFGGLEQRGDVTARNDHRMPERDGKPVAIGHGEFIFGDDAMRVELAEGTGFGFRCGHAVGMLVLMVRSG